MSCRVASRRVASRRVASRRVASRRVASRRVASRCVGLCRMMLHCVALYGSAPCFVALCCNGAVWRCSCLLLCPGLRCYAVRTDYAALSCADRLHRVHYVANRVAPCRSCACPHDRRQRRMPSCPSISTRMRGSFCLRLASMGLDNAASSKREGR